MSNPKNPSNRIDQAISDLHALEKEQQALHVYVERFTGLKNLFNAACLSGNGIEADKYRAELHHCLDEILDHSATGFTITRKFITL